MKYCTRCGAELIDEAVVCTKCGCVVGSTGFVATNGGGGTGASGVSQRFIIGLSMMIMGVVGLIYSLVTISKENSRYSSAGFASDTDETMIAILVASIIVSIVGLVVLLWSKGKAASKKKKKARTLREKVFIWVLVLVAIINLIFFSLFNKH
ncbi:hypothetical protein R80B4_02791 [Fibrobacteres bacterium R8-0-B4]